MRQILNELLRLIEHAVFIPRSVPEREKKGKN